MRATGAARALGAGLALLLPAAAPSAVRADEPPAEALLATLPFQEWPEPNRVVVDLAPEGQSPFRMMLDTGAQSCVMTPRMARSLGVSVRRNKSSPYRRKTVLGRDLQFWVDTSRSDTGSAYFEYGLLGGEFLDDYVVEIDFPGRVVRFFDAKKYEVPEAAPDSAHESIVPLTITARRPFLEVEVDGQPVRVLLDTGDPFTASLSGRSASQAGIDVDALPEWHDAHFVLGPTEQLLYEAKSFRLGGFAFEPLPMTVLPRGSYNLGGSTDSAIGYDVLRPFVVRLDYRRKRMWMKRTAPIAITYWAADWKIAREIGALLTPLEGTWYVWRVEPEGLAAAYGLREGDRIVAPAGGALPEAAEVARRIRAREDLTASRQRDDVVVDVLLPEAGATPEVAPSAEAEPAP